MINSIPHNKLRNITMLVTLAVITASCGSYQQSSYYNNDGIYSDNASTTVERRPEQSCNKECKQSHICIIDNKSNTGRSDIRP